MSGEINVLEGTDMREGIKSGWSADLIDSLRHSLRNRPEWRSRLAGALKGAHAIHLAIFNEPFLSYILEGRKTIESRFTKKPIQPYQSVKAGDIVLLKRSSGPVVAACVVGEVKYFELDEHVQHELRQQYAQPLCATDSDFWAMRAEKRYATLFGISDLQPLPNLPCGKRDRRGWVTIGGASLGSSQWVL